MKINRKIPDIITFNISNQKLLYAKNSNKSLYLDDKHIDDDIDTNEYFFIKDILYRKKGGTFYGKEKLFDSSFLGKSVNHQDSSFILKSDTELDEEDFSIISNYSFFSLLNSEKIYLSRLKNIIHCINKSNFVFLGSDKNIYAYTLPNANLLWEFDLSELGSYFDTFSREEKKYEVAKFLGIWDNQLLVALREHIILSLDIRTGKIVQKWQNIEGLFYDDVTKDLIPKASSFVLYKGKLIGALYKFYFEIDLSNGTTHFTDLSSTMEENGILSIYPINDNPIDFPNIYLTAMMKEQPKKPQWSYDCLFCLDIESKEIKWKYTFEDSSLGVKIPQYSNGKLYQLDNDNTLHIFEKE
ncbi:hypothetical protein KRX57_08490 [Weeksellaceae bacterium TAE3-ERU29]|nr:hypothetical protein [Weeksellaceae bacterium TAE3-ERU29]